VFTSETSSSSRLRSEGIRQRLAIAPRSLSRTYANGPVLHSYYGRPLWRSVRGSLKERDGHKAKRPVLRGSAPRHGVVWPKAAIPLRRRTAGKADGPLPILCRLSEGPLPGGLVGNDLRLERVVQLRPASQSSAGVLHCASWPDRRCPSRDWRPLRPAATRFAAVFSNSTKPGHRSLQSA
jgi:hypothetical protein